MDFGYALKALKEGRKVVRSGWNEEFETYLKLKHEVSGDVNIYLCRPRDSAASIWDIHGYHVLADDWRIVK